MIVLVVAGVAFVGTACVLALAGHAPEGQELDRARALLGEARDHQHAYVAEGLPFDRERALELATEALRVVQALELRASYRDGPRDAVRHLREDARALRDALRELA